MACHELVFSYLLDKEESKKDKNPLWMVQSLKVYNKTYQLVQWETKTTDNVGSWLEKS
jgi:hypothetical protein